MPAFPPRTASNDARALLDSIHDAVTRRDALIRINGLVRSTKVGPEQVDLTLLRLAGLEDAASAALSRAFPGGWSIVLDRYNVLDPTVGSLEQPSSFTVRLLRGHAATYDGRNVFLFMPFAAGIDDRDALPEDFFNLNFMDVIEAIFDQIVSPTMRRVFDGDSQAAFFALFSPGVPLQSARVLMDAMHEIGHRVGPWRVIPDRHPDMTVAPGFAFDALGELWTDTTMARVLPELPALALGAAFERIFSYARRGFAADAESASVNLDNDAWTGAFLFNRFVTSGAFALCAFASTIESSGAANARTARWSLDVPTTMATLASISEEIEALGGVVLAALPSHRDAIVAAWMNQQVAQVDGRFVLPSELAEIFARVSDLPEIPRVGPLVEEPGRQPIRGPLADEKR